MRILLVIHSLRRGGAERVALDLARGFLFKGHAVRIVALLSKNDFPSETRDVDIIFLQRAERYRWPASVPELARALGLAAREFRADVVQIHTPTAAIVAAWAGIKAPVQHVVHGYGSMTRALTPKSWLMKRLDRWAGRKLRAHVVVVAPAMKSSAARHWHCREKDIACIPNGIDFERFPVAPRVAGQAPVILMVGTLAPVKCHLHGIAAMPGLLATWPQARLRIAGDGPLRAVLERRIAELGLGQCVELLGQRTDVAQLMAQADVLWHLSESEGLPLVVAEAMATGLPVVGHDVRGIRDIVQNGTTGFLIPFGDQPALIARTLQLLTDRSAYESCAQGARVRVAENFTATGMIAAHEAALASLLVAA